MLGLNLYPYNPYGMTTPIANRPNCLFWVKTKGKKVKRTKKQKKVRF